MKSKISASLTVAFTMAWLWSPAALGGPAVQEIGHAAHPGQPAKPLLVAKAKTSKKILADFIDAISRQEYDGALSMLRPEMSEEWTLAGFAEDWEVVRQQLSGGWGPKLTGTFAGQSPQGPYEQATYKLANDWRSFASVDLVAMSIGGEPRIVKIHIRTPVNDSPSQENSTRIEAFVEAMLSEDYDAVQAMFAPERRMQYPSSMLAQIRPVLSETQHSTSKHHYWLNANTVWYDAVRLTSPNDPASFLEVIMEAGTDGPQIVSLVFKGRLPQ